jgi:hypothetical protein
MGVPVFCVLLARIECACRWPLAQSSRCSVDAPDSPVYTGHVRWIIAEQPLWFPEAGEFLRPLFLGAPDTVRCTPDSPVNYSGVPLEIPEGGEFELESSGAPDTVQWRTGHCPVYTGQSGALDQRCLRLTLCSLVEPNTWSFYWLRVNLLHLYNLCTRAN